MESQTLQQPQIQPIQPTRPTPQLSQHRSEQLNELFSALAKAQSEMKPAGLNSENPYFKTKYAALSDIVKVSRPALTKYGLCVIQEIRQSADGTSCLQTVLGHSSGQWISSTMKIFPPKPDVQTLGSYITYLRRYSYAALVGVVTSDEDDDAELTILDTHKPIIKRPIIAGRTA
jgi:hypothetical protein